MKTAIYPGSFDPITNGHVDVIQRASVIFDRVVVAVAASERKQPCIAASDRLALVQRVFAGIANVDVVPLQGLLVDVAQQHQAGFVVKGLRNAEDFEYERQQAWMNATMAPTDLETVCLFAGAEQDKVSSTMVREIAALGGDVSAFVPSEVIDYLAQKA